MCFHLVWCWCYCMWRLHYYLYNKGLTASLPSSSCTLLSYQYLHTAANLYMHFLNFIFCLFGSLLGSDQNLLLQHIFLQKSNFDIDWIVSHFFDAIRLNMAVTPSLEDCRLSLQNSALLQSLRQKVEIWFQVCYQSI